MDKKRNILIREMVSLSDKVKVLSGTIESKFSEAYLALQKANITIGVNNSLKGQIPIENNISVTYRSVMGVEIPVVSTERTPLRPQYEILYSNAEFDRAFILFNEVKRLSATLAEIENSIYRLTIAIKKTQKRANALENILIPSYNHQVRFIANALEEKEREEFSRQKVIKAGKAKKIMKAKNKSEDYV